MTTEMFPKIDSKAIGFHLYADVDLLTKASDILVWQSLYNIVNQQYDVSEPPEKVNTTLKELACLVNIKNSVVLSSLKRLEKIGLIKRNDTSIIVEFNKYLKIVRFFESLQPLSQTKFKKDFKNIGTLAFDKWTYHRTHKRYANHNNLMKLPEHGDFINSVKN